MDHVRLAGHAAQALRPPGYDPEVVYLVAVLQNLGRLLVQYHFPEESEQIRQLMQPHPPAQPGAPEHPGMSEESAAYAVLGVDIESLGAAVARHWGLGDEVQHMIRRLPARQAGAHARQRRRHAARCRQRRQRGGGRDDPAAGRARRRGARPGGAALHARARARRARDSARRCRARAPPCSSGTSAPAMKRGGTLDGDATGTGPMTRPSFTGDETAQAAGGGV